MKFDMHCHTKEGSLDSKIPINEYIQKYYMLGYDGFMISDHNSFRGCRKSHSIDCPDGFTIIRGIEYDTKDAGHVLIILPDGVYPKVLHLRGMKISKLANLVHRLGGILGLAHPFGAPSSSAMGFTLMKMEYVELVDFIEVFNTCESPDSNALAQELADKYSLPGFAGTDAHDGQYIGMAATEIHWDIHCNNDFIEAVMNQAPIKASGTEREKTKKGNAKDSWFAQLGYKIYNRGLAKIKMPRRKYKHKKLINHIKS